MMVKGIGPRWMYVLHFVDIEEFDREKEKYGEVICDIHNRVVQHLKVGYGFEDHCVMADHEQRVFGVQAVMS
ncbi:hypothetical protein [Peribacillus sp. NPDC097295]|uniref:hypothetical protein n=1 Tax=Peribacillus sp. NPDC097295 TaxID=3364402 RepID=UPI003809A239